MKITRGRTILISILATLALAFLTIWDGGKIAGATSPYHQWQAPSCWYQAGASVGCVQEDGGTTWTTTGKTGNFDPLIAGVTTITRGASVDGGLAANALLVGGTSAVLATGQTAAFGFEGGTQGLTAGAATVTFGTAFGASPNCTCTDGTSAAAVKCAPTSTQLSISGTGADTIEWICIGQK